MNTFKNMLRRWSDIATVTSPPWASAAWLFATSLLSCEIAGAASRLWVAAAGCFGCGVSCFRRLRDD